MFTENAMICAYLIGMVSCLAAVAIGGFIERTSKMAKDTHKTTHKSARRYSMRAKEFRQSIRMPEKKYNYLQLLRNVAGI